jgi:TRAP-type mannitol/chloroaromatic compound transport system substrate-binding protein
MTSRELTAWVRFMGGQELWDEIYDQFGVQGFLSGDTGTQAGGWFRNELTSLESVKGLRFRTPGLGGRVWEKLGATVTNMAGGEIFQALQSGTLDAAEFVGPYNDLALGFYQVAKYYYFPGWHQQSTFFDLMMNKAEWDALDDQTKAIFETVCEANMIYGIAEGEAIQSAALAELEKQGVNLKTFDPAILESLEAAWNEVVEEEKAANPNFVKAWESLSKFRKEYETWSNIGYLKK